MAVLPDLCPGSEAGSDISHSSEIVLDLDLQSRHDRVVGSFAAAERASVYGRDLSR